MALVFALLVNAFLVINFYWTALITTGQRNACLVALLGAWVFLMVLDSLWKKRLSSIPQTEQQDETFRQSICHYLRGDWFAVEAQILPYLQKYPKDVEMLLLQATLYRHTERYEEALLVLDHLQLLLDSRYWQGEIGDERSLVVAALRSSDTRRG